MKLPRPTDASWPSRLVARTLAALPLLLGCGTEDVVVATLPVNAGVTGDSVCATNDDCAPASFCARRSCGDPQGACQLRPVLCDDQGPPTCDCDGVSYWNDCLRMQYGATASSEGSCSSGAATCMDDNALDCPVLGAACAKLFPPGVPCEDDAMGACWVLPVACPAFAAPDWWSTCSGPMECHDTCEAIRAGRPYQHDLTRQCMRPPGH